MFEKFYIYKTSDFSTTISRKIEHREDWVLYGSFYGFNPLIKPIPTGMKLFCIKIKEEYPYNVIDVEIEYDLFNMRKNCIYFLNYIKPTLNTEQLYFLKTGNGIVATFEKNHYDQLDISPLYVITDNSIQNIPISDLKFKCFNDICTPWINQIDDIHIDDHYPPMNLNKCLEYCIHRNRKEKHTKNHIFVTIFLLVIVLFVNSR